MARASLNGTISVLRIGEWKKAWQRALTRKSRDLRIKDASAKANARAESEEAVSEAAYSSRVAREAQEWAG